jgi:predicted Zn-dependent peptidase
MATTYTFPNGFRVIYENPAHSTDATIINAFCKVGSVFEPSHLRGVSHFIEHMCFKGANKHRNIQQIFKVYDDIGAYFNAYTAKQYSCYVSQFDNAHAARCITTIAEIMLLSTFNEIEYEKELNVVIEENVRNSNDYESIAQDLTSAMLYKGSVYSYPVDSLKYHKIVDKWDYNEVFDFYHRFYVPENIVFSIVSVIPFLKIKHILENSYFVKHYPRVTPRTNMSNTILPKMALVPQDKMRIQMFPISGLNTIYICLGFRTCSSFSEDKYPLEILSVLLGGKYTSRMKLLLREKHGLTYSSSVSTQYYETSGDFILFAITDNENIIRNLKHQSKHGKTAHKVDGKRRPNGGTKKKSTRQKLPGVFPVISELLHRLIRSGVSAEETHNAKTFTRGKQRMDLEKVNEPVEYNGTEFLLGDAENLIRYNELYETKYAHIMPVDVNRVIDKYFKPENMCLSIVGGNLPSQTVIEKYCRGIFR